MPNGQSWQLGWPGPRDWRSTKESPSSAWLDSRNATDQGRPLPPTPPSVFLWIGTLHGGYSRPGPILRTGRGADASLWPHGGEGFVRERLHLRNYTWEASAVPEPRVDGTLTPPWEEPSGGFRRQWEHPACGQLWRPASNDPHFQAHRFVQPLPRAGLCHQQHMTEVMVISRN